MAGRAKRQVLLPIAIEALYRDTGQVADVRQVDPRVGHQAVGEQPECRLPVALDHALNHGAFLGREVPGVLEDVKLVGPGTLQVVQQQIVVGRADARAGQDVLLQIRRGVELGLIAQVVRGAPLGDHGNLRARRTVLRVAPLGQGPHAFEHSHRGRIVVGVATPVFDDGPGAVGDGPAEAARRAGGHLLGRILTEYLGFAGVVWMVIQFQEVELVGQQHRGYGRGTVRRAAKPPNLEAVVADEVVQGGRVNHPPHGAVRPDRRVAELFAIAAPVAVVGPDEHPAAGQVLDSLTGLDDRLGNRHAVEGVVVHDRPALDRILELVPVALDALGRRGDLRRVERHRIVLPGGAQRVVGAVALAQPGAEAVALRGAVVGELAVVTVGIDPLAGVLGVHHRPDHAPALRMFLQVLKQRLQIRGIGFPICPRREGRRQGGAAFVAFERLEQDHLIRVLVGPPLRHVALGPDHQSAALRILPGKLGEMQIQNAEVERLRAKPGVLHVGAGRRVIPQAEKVNSGVFEDRRWGELVIVRKRAVQFADPELGDCAARAIGA